MKINQLVGEGGGKGKKTTQPKPQPKPQPVKIKRPEDGKHGAGGSQANDASPVAPSPVNLGQAQPQQVNPQQNTTQPKPSYLDKAKALAPNNLAGKGIGALAGGLAGSALGPAGTVAGAGIGAGLGNNIQNHIKNQDYAGLGNMAAQTAAGVGNVVGGGLGGLYHGFTKGASGGKFTGGMRALATGGLKTGGITFPQFRGPGGSLADDKLDVEKVNGLDDTHRNTLLTALQAEHQYALQQGQEQEWIRNNAHKASILSHYKLIANNPSPTLTTPSAPPATTPITVSATNVTPKEDIDRLRTLSGI
jgi:hypothetical protein